MAGRYRASIIYDDGLVLYPARDDVFNLTPTGQPNPFAESATQLFPLGTLLEEIGTGRKWRYCKNGATLLAVGKTVNPAATPADHIKDLAVPTAVAVGATTVALTNGATTALTANMYAGGFLYVNDCGAGTGEGVAYRVKSHPAAAVDAACTFTLYDPVAVAMTTAAQCGLRLPVWTGLVISASPQVTKVVGVPQIPVTASYYFWCQTQGPVAVLSSGTLIAGVEVGPALAAGVDGAVIPLTGVATETTIGQCINFALDTEYSLVYLQCE